MAARPLVRLVQVLKQLQAPKPAPRRRKRSEFIALSGGSVVHEEKLPKGIRQMLVRHRRSERAFLRSARPTLARQ